MAARRVSASIVDWGALAAKIPAENKATFTGLKVTSQQGHLTGLEITMSHIHWPQGNKVTFTQAYKGHLTGLEITMSHIHWPQGNNLSFTQANIWLSPLASR